MKLEIIEKEKHIIAIKPVGMHTTYKNSQDTSDCAVKFITEKYPDLLSVPSKKPREGGLLYRLDQDTSGVLIFAKSQDEYNRLFSLQQENMLMKKYHAVCTVAEGFYSSQLKPADFRNMLDKAHAIADVTPPSEFLRDTDKSRAGDKYFKIDYPVGHSKKTGKRMIAVKTSKYKTSGSPRSARTFIKISKDSANPSVAYVEAYITKAMRHQIRVHLSAVGLPIIGDSLYYPNSVSLPKDYSTNRLMLNCSGVYEIQNGLG
ncbi:hypothetical protein GF357_02120 [Candidatus Dojkabacteria bacterium]|nr:hypothetical protein [Candidatus Dojkabacteria bacterium]